MNKIKTIKIDDETINRNWLRKNMRLENDKEN